MEQQELDDFHRSCKFEFPAIEEVVASPLTGTAYIFGPEIGRGAHGIVFWCEDEWENRLAAKVIKPNGISFSEIENKAADETVAQHLAKSPHIVNIHDTFVYKGAHYIISEYCGSTLRGIMCSPAFNPNVWFPALSNAILQALHYMHVQNLAHCDIHAGNVFLKFQDDAILPEEQSATIFKLGDFGLTRSLNNMEARGTFYNYLCPPEAINPDKFGALDHRADIYQAGLLFLSVLSSHEWKFTQEEIMDGRPRRLAEALPRVEGEFIAKMLHRHVEERPPTALDAWREFKQNAQYQ